MSNSADAHEPSEGADRRERRATLWVGTRAAIFDCALIAGGITLYLGATFVGLAAGWFLPGRGIETISMRLVLGCALPAVGALWLQERLRIGKLKPLATALLIGMIVVGLACMGGAIGMITGFRVLEQ